MDEHLPTTQSSLEAGETNPSHGGLSPTLQPLPHLIPSPMVSRWAAAAADNVIAVILAYVAAKSASDDLPLLQGVLFVGTYLGYFFISEALFSRTFGKLCAGLVVVCHDGRRCGWQRSAIRTSFRFLEVNPILLGALPAALSIVFSKHRQRIGDLVANTFVVQARRI
jgi:uncharacterized RDD family membrane protein YckC